ncbi:uncharacterized protein LOC116847065 isoform X2 [Odontomachus brunneus]|uniref:uncharacterized protein LOC116847065 isoform X2 n=1 Tax=Odontomachus brunneus TaxID=486640 RepID=UPI0013F29B31|nr:uncharacterized protein LOC116847065 isoform X2 [Odontomachus brunneus]
MENQGYEEEQSRVEEKQSTSESHYCDRKLHMDTVDGDSLFTKITTHPESHVYEDISTTESSFKISERASFPDETQNIRETQNCRSTDFTKQAWTNETSITSPVIEKSFQQNSTLSSSTGISANRDSVNSFERAVSRTIGDDTEISCRNRCDLSGNLHKNVEANVSSLSRQNENSSRETTEQPDRRPNRRRKKKDCKQCKSKLANTNSCEKLDELAASKDTILRENKSNHRDKDPDAPNFLFRDSILRSQNIKIYPILNRTSLRDLGTRRSCSVPMCENGPRLTEGAVNLLANARNNKMLDQTGSNQNKLLDVPNNETDMRVNSIYSQGRWYGKDMPIFYTNLKDQNPFQRAYSLPVRTHTPTSQNRVNLRRSVRNDPPPHPARLDKHRRGWTLHLARPLKTSGCSCSLIPLLIIVLILLGIAGVALYIVFEPEKLQIIQQYLKSSTNNLTEQNVTSGESFTPVISNDEPNLVDTTDTSTTVTTMMTSVDAFTMSALLKGDPSFPEISSPSTNAEMKNASQNVNATRYCDDCYEGEVCVALVDEEVPICRIPHDSEDPTGCAGFCTVNKQKCHRLDVDAFRCVKIEHHCLENEFTCSNTLCIPMEKHCDGHMNCYDHSDEYDCVCNLETHFQCGNETSCLPLERRCDGKIDCWDATDEINCTLACPLESEFTCNNGECISKVRFCDGLTDCSDGSDEPHGCQGRCNKHEFTCQNGRCITKGMKCNGVDDCGDGTDERHCKDRFT